MLAGGRPPPEMGEPTLEALQARIGVLEHQAGVRRQRAEPPQPQRSTVEPGGEFSSDPLHHPDIVQMIVRGETSGDNWQRTLHRVQAEIQSRKPLMPRQSPGTPADFERADAQRGTDQFGNPPDGRSRAIDPSSQLDQNLQSELRASRNARMWEQAHTGQSEAQGPMFDRGDASIALARTLSSTQDNVVRAAAITAATHAVVRSHGICGDRKHKNPALAKHCMHCGKALPGSQPGSAGPIAPDTETISRRGGVARSVAPRARPTRRRGSPCRPGWRGAFSRSAAT